MSTGRNIMSLCMKKIAEPQYIIYVKTENSVKYNNRINWVLTKRVTEMIILL